MDTIEKKKKPKKKAAVKKDYTMVEKEKNTVDVDAVDDIDTVRNEIIKVEKPVISTAGRENEGRAIMNNEIGSSPRNTNRAAANRKKRVENASKRKANMERERQAEEEKKKATKKRRRTAWLIFWLVLSIYVVVLFHYAEKLLDYTDESLQKYEDSQAVYFMEDYFKQFCKEVESGKLLETVDLSKYVNEFDSLEYVQKKFLKDVEGKKLSYAKDAKSYNTEAPVYNVFAGDKEIAKITLKGYDEEVILGILTVLKWKVDKIEYEMGYESDTHSYTITAPYGYTVYANGRPLSDKYLTDRTVPVDLFQYAKEYTELHDMRIYEINDVENDVEISIRDIDGNPVECKVEGNNYSADYVRDAQIPDELRDAALFMSQTWSLFMTRDLPGINYGFDTVAQCLINGSYYYKKAYEWATGVDITFTSPHTLLDPMFTNVKVDEYVKYSETCFACHVYFDKTMFLTVTSQQVTDTTDLTFIFVFYDDTDDGVYNPHWAIVDMM